MGFLTYDLIFLGIFLVFFSSFLYVKRKKIQKEGLLLLYKTSWGIKLIDKLGNGNKKVLKFLSWVSIITGYILMIGVLYLIYRIVEIYLFQPAVVQAIKIPPILPLFPYLPQVFSLSFLPPFYFTYWIVILAIIAITHELSHGIFAAYNKVKIKTTGFGFFPFFFPIFMAAFVEPDEKQMEKKSKFSQMAVLSGGTFANVIVAIVFFLILGGFFALAFAPAGVQFDTFATASVPISSINMIGGINVTNPTYQTILNDVGGNLTRISTGNYSYLGNKQIIQSQSSSSNTGNLILYFDSPAIKANLSSIVTGINNVSVKSISDLEVQLGNYKPGDKVNIVTLNESGNGLKNNEVVLGNSPAKPGVAWLGIGFIDSQNSLISYISFKQAHVYYEPLIDPTASLFIYNLLWWLVIIAISVALINMLPMGIFDGGRFFYLTVWGITGKKEIAEKAYKFSTQFFIFILVLIMFLWAIRVI